jgi:hypothetical protein
MAHYFKQAKTHDMKTKILNLKSLAMVLAATFTFAGISNTAMANKTKSQNVKQLLQPTVKYLGTENNTALFSVEAMNEVPVKFVLNITDAEGNRVFSQQYDTTNFSKLFKLVADSNSSNPLGLSFEIVVLSTGEKHSFEVNTTTETVNEVQVTKI